MGTRISHLTQGMKLRACAQECRRLAAMEKQSRVIAQYLGLADSYDDLAAREEKLADRASKNSSA